MRDKNEGVEYLPTTGVRTDVKRFINKYLEHNTVRYQQFVQVWRHHNMVYLCAGRASDREAREFVERVLHIAQEYFLPPYQFQVRVGGLYLLYAIYQIQPLSPKVKIRLTPCQWQDSVFFQQQAAQQNHLDVVYVFQRLLQEQAFLFCYTPSEMSIHSVVKETDEMGDDLADRLKEEKSAVTSLFNYESLEKLSYLQDQYQQMKIGLAGPNATTADKSLDVVLTELVEDIVVLLQSFKEKVSSFSRQGQKPEDTNGQEPVVETTGSRRQMLKSLAYSQPRPRTNKHQSHTVVSSSSTSPAKSTLSGSGEAGRGTRKDKLSPVTSSTHRRPSCRSRLQDVDTRHSEGDTDKDYVPSPAKKMRQHTKQGNQRQIPAEQQPAADSSTDVQPSKDDSADLQTSMISMPVIVDPDMETMVSPCRLAECRKTCRREVLAEQNSASKEPAQFNQPGKKRKIARKWPGLTCMEETYKDAKHRHPSEENCSHGSTAASSNHQNVSQIKDRTSLQTKVAFKFQKPGKKSDENRTTGQDVAETKSWSRRRGRPRKSEASEGAEVARLSEMIVSGNNGSNLHEKKAKYELVVFPTGTLTSVLNVASCRSDLAAYRTQINNTSLKSGHISEAVQHITSKVRLTPGISHHGLFTSETAKVHNKQMRRKRCGSDSVTLTEIFVGKEIGKPAAIQSQVIHRQVADTRLTTPSAQTSTGQTSHTHDVAESHSATSHPTSAAVEADSVEGSNSSLPVNILGQKDNGNGLLHRQKEQGKRQLDEVDQQSLTQSVKVGQQSLTQSVKVDQQSLTQSVKVDQQSLTQSVKVDQQSLTQSVKVGQQSLARSVKVDQQSLARSVKRSRAVDREPAATTQQKIAALRNRIIRKTGTSTPDPRSATVEAGNVEESNTSQSVKLLKKYNTRDSIRRLKERCQRQMESGDRESVAEFVTRFVAEDRQAQLLQSVPRSHQSTAVLREASVISQQSTVMLREPSVISQQSTVMLREPSVISQQSTVMLREASVISQQSTAGLRKLLNGPPVTNHLSVGVSPQLQTQHESPHKISAARNIKTVSKDILPPWTSKQRSSSRSPTSQKPKFCPKIQENKKVDPSLVRYRFL